MQQECAQMNGGACRDSQNMHMEMTERILEYEYYIGVQVVWVVCCCFFFSSRRRHTRYWRDWSSDVCSSDLSALEPSDGLIQVVLRKVDLAPGTADGRLERRRSCVREAERVRERVELVRGGTRRPQVAPGERDCDLRGQAAETQQRVGEVREAPLDRRRRGVDLSLRKPKEREAGLRVAAPLLRLPVRLLGSREVAAPAADLADLVEPRGGRPRVEALELLARLERLLLGLRPVALHPRN